MVSYVKIGSKGREKNGAASPTLGGLRNGRRGNEKFLGKERDNGGTVNDCGLLNKIK